MRKKVCWMVLLCTLACILSLSALAEAPEEALLRLINEKRAQAELPPLAPSDALAEAAQIRASEITETFGHTRPDGSPWKTVFPKGVEKRGEALHRFADTAEETMASFMDSTGHSRLLTDPDFALAGVALSKSEGQSYWALLLSE